MKKSLKLFVGTIVLGASVFAFSQNFNSSKINSVNSGGSSNLVNNAIQVIPNKINKPIPIGSVRYDSLMIINTGTDTLNFSTQFNYQGNPNQSWFSYSPQNGSVLVGDTAKIYCSFDANGSNPGAKKGTITINSNASNDPVVDFDVKMLPNNGVSSNPPNGNPTPGNPLVGNSQPNGNYGVQFKLQGNNGTLGGLFVLDENSPNGTETMSVIQFGGTQNGIPLAAEYDISGCALEYEGIINVPAAALVGISPIAVAHEGQFIPIQITFDPNGNAQISFTITSCSSYYVQDPDDAPFGAPSPTPIITSIQQNNNDVTISWTPVSGATGYNLYYDVVPGGLTNQISVGGSLTYTHTNAISSGNNYYYLVKAID